MSKTDQMSFFGFEAEPAAASAKPVKAKARKPAAPAVKLPELILTESAPSDMPAIMPAAPAPSLPQAPVNAAPESMNASVAPADEAEAMAQRLAQHPDYRILRRLVPQTDFGPLNGQGTQLSLIHI